MSDKIVVGITQGDVNGIGYNVFVSLRDIETLPETGMNIKLYT